MLYDDYLVTVLYTVARDHRNANTVTLYCGKNYITITGSQNKGFAFAVLYASHHCDRKLF